MVKLDSVRKGLRNFVLQDISFELPKGYIMGLIGENGAGKTSLLNLILGLYQPDSGTVQLFDKTYTSNECEIRNNISYVLSDNDLFLANTKLVDNAKMFGKYYEYYSEHMLACYCRQFSLDLHMKWKHLSKGERLKFQFAFALSHQPKLLVLDEPTANFDPEFREQFLHIITDFVNDGEHSVILATHQTQDLDRVADYVAFLHQGKQVFYMDKEALMERFRLVQGEEYKVNLLKQERLVYKEKKEYVTAALVRHRKIDSYDRQLDVSVPTIEDIMYYLVKRMSKDY